MTCGSHNKRQVTDFVGKMQYYITKVHVQL